MQPEISKASEYEIFIPTKVSLTDLKKKRAEVQTKLDVSNDEVAREQANVVKIQERNAPFIDEATALLVELDAQIATAEGLGVKEVPMEVVKEEAVIAEPVA